MAGAAGADSQGRRRRGAVRGKRPRRGRGWCVRGAGSAVGPFVDAIQALVRSIWGALAGRFPFGGDLSHGVAVGWRVKCTFGAPGGERGNPNARPNPKLKAQPGCAPTGHAVDSPRQRRGKPATPPGCAPTGHPFSSPRQRRGKPATPPRCAPTGHPSSSPWQRRGAPPPPYASAPTGHPSSSPRHRRGAPPPPYASAPTGHAVDSPWQRRGKPATRPVEAPQNGRCPATGARSAGPAHALKHSCDAVPETCLCT